MERQQWQPIYGDFANSGVSLRRVNVGYCPRWAGALESGAIHLFLNLSGSSFVFGPVARLSMASKTLGVCHIGDASEVMATVSSGGELNEIFVLCVTAEWVTKYFGSKKQSLHIDLVKLIDTESQASVLINKVRSMSYLEYELCVSLLNPPVHNDARSFWYLAKIIELLSIHLFKPKELGASETFCSHQKRIASQRVDKVLIWLEEHLDIPLDLKALAEHVNCSASYLSRIFSENTGKTISQKLREIRVQKAADLLDAGDYNVTEAAMEVGYNSVSHFTKAFYEEKGVKPSQYNKDKR